MAKKTDFTQYGRKGGHFSKLRWVRQMKGYSIGELAKEAGVTVRVLKSYEYGERDFAKARVDTVYRLATALGVPMEDIVDIPIDEE